ncbi:MAG TPA: HAD family hydrolase [Lacipirellulaceae bacterium]|jgi:phosphoglycolate phosphatase-like HAD superfamily hydrolase|nr:HAD family hydrolase [Lacipirellulaceae bacterium]
MHICLLDIDGTLVLTGGAGQTAFAQTFAEDFGIAEINSQIAFAGRSDRAIAADLFIDHGVEPSEANWQSFCRGYLDRLSTALTSHKGKILPGVGPLLDALKNRGDIAIGLVTGNVREGARRKLVHYDLWHWFLFGGFGDDHTERCDIAAAALSAAKLHLNGGDSREGDKNSTPRQHGEIVVIGDTQHDVSCGRSIDARCVAVATGQTSLDVLRSAKPDLLLNSLEDLDPILDLFD